jgi:hypothetical protein
LISIERFDKDQDAVCNLFGENVTVEDTSIAIQATIGVLYFMNQPPTNSKYEATKEPITLAQFLNRLIQSTLEHVDSVITDLMDEFEEHGMLMDTGESRQWEAYLPLLKLIIRYLNSDLFRHFKSKIEIGEMLKWTCSVATKVSQLQKQVYTRFSTVELPWFQEDIALKGYAPLQGTWFTNEDMVDVNHWESFDMTRMQCHEFMIGIERLCEDGLVVQHATTNGLVFRVKSMESDDIWKSPSVGTPGSFRVDPSPGVGTPFSGLMLENGFSPTPFRKMTPLKSTPVVSNVTLVVSSSKMTPMTSSKITPMVLSTPPRKDMEDPFAKTTDELDTLSFLGLGSPIKSAQTVPLSSLKYSQKKVITSGDDPLKEDRDSLKAYRNESELFKKLSNHQRDMVMPLWEDYLPIFPKKEDR